MEDPQTIWMRAFFEQTKAIGKTLNTMCVQLGIVIVLLIIIALK